MEKINKGDNEAESLNFFTENVEKLKSIFPEIVSESKIDFEVLKSLLGEEIVEADEYYSFNWNGKAKARREAHKPSTATLLPVKEKSLNWDETNNLYIEGDNLEVLKLMQKSYSSKIKLIYIDPPYNTGKDFVYKDDYSDNLHNYKKLTGQIDSEGNKLSTNSESDGRYHSNWLNMMYPRLTLARNLLTKDGFIFISIDDSELYNLKKVCDEIFGEANFIANPVRRRRKSQANLSQNISTIHEYVLIYAKTANSLLNKIKGEIDKSKYKNPDNDPRGPYVTMPCTNKGGAKYSVTTPTGKIIEEEWRFKKETYETLYADNKLVFPRGGEGKPRYKLFLSEKLESGVIPNSWWANVSSNQEATASLKELFDDKVIFDHPKPIDLIKLIIELGACDNSICLDFFSGSASTAHGVMEYNEENGKNISFIQVQIPEPTDSKSDAFKAGYTNLADIGIDRLKKVSSIIKAKNPMSAVDTGFKVFRLDSSNIKTWDGGTVDIQQNLLDAVSNIKEDRTEEDVLFEILLKYGLDLTLPIEEKEIEGSKVFNVGYGALFICLSDKISSKVAQGIGKWKEQLEPEICRVIFKDSGFSDVEKTNSIQNLKRFGITEIKSI